ncbi:MAG TPA: YihY/virulence factor BrkB family protein [Candidatus Limnocylindrales bacterium]|nr:YihY/virulence factor BrkB family protein [Candidatus Limnocylindrales bacterium]
MDVLRRVIANAVRNDLGGLAAEIAYRFLFALFPFGLFVVALGALVAGLLHVANPAGQVMSGIGDNLPPSIAATIKPELQRLLDQPSGAAIGLGALVALVTATGGTNALIKGMHRAYGVPETRPLVLRYATALGLTLLGAVGVLVSFVTIIGGALLTTKAAAHLGLGGAGWDAIQLLRWPAVFVILTVAVTVMYRFAPNVVVPWRWILAGSVSFALAWLVATALLGLYVERFANYGATYGSLGGVIVLLTWFYVTAALLLLGAELTAALAAIHGPGEVRPRETADAAARADDVATEVADRARRRLDRPGAN